MRHHIKYPEVTQEIGARHKSVEGISTALLLLFARANTARHAPIGARMYSDTLRDDAAEGARLRAFRSWP